MAVAADNSGPGDRRLASAVGDRDVCHAVAKARDSAARVRAPGPNHVCKRSLQRFLEQNQQQPGAESGG